MLTEKITPELAWQLTLLSRQRWSFGMAQLTLRVNTAISITVYPGGDWTSNVPAEPAAACLLDRMLPLANPMEERLTVAQMGQSLDGRIATDTGASHYINGPDGITHLHRMRALVDAVLVGAGTASADNPQLTVRHVTGSNPVRVILDPNRRVPSCHQVFQDPASPTLRLVSDGRDLSGPGVTDVAIPNRRGDGLLPGESILDILSGRGLKRVLVEGGGLTVSAFLQADLLDRLHVLVAPLIIGSGRPAFTLPPMTDLEGALRPRARVFDLGSDTLFDLQPRLAALPKR